MKFEYVTWTIDELLMHYYDDELDLSPPYQRNEVWTKKSQRELIDTIVKDQPIPSFFVYKKASNKFEMVDGQQRSRSIILFFKDSKKPLLTSEGLMKKDFPNFGNYPLNITLISEIEPDEHIEEFYALVNRTGLRLNKPELFKAQYYETNFLKLIEDIANDDEFKRLGLFRSVSRMNDNDFISELLALLKFGISEKKEKVDELFENDIKLNECRILEKEFFKVISILNDLGRIKPINNTRYRQKNDFYTLFSLINEYHDKGKVLESMYKWLIVVEEDIFPTQEECEPFQKYAYHCVTQSNSKNARNEREKTLKEIIFPDTNLLTTKRIMEFYDIDESYLVTVDGLTMYNHSLFNMN